MIKRETRFDEELGKAVCDRLGLPHKMVLRDYSTESAGKTVWVTMTVMKAIPLDEYNELLAAAAKRAA
jgi:hypothetical protein